MIIPANGGIQPGAPLLPAESFGGDGVKNGRSNGNNQELGAEVEDSLLFGRNQPQAGEDVVQASQTGGLQRPADYFRRLIRRQQGFVEPVKHTLSSTEVIDKPSCPSF